MSNWQSELGKAIDRRFDQMVDLRRRLHMNPEVSGEEFETSFLLYRELGNSGFQVSMGPEGRGVIADLGADEQEPSTGIFAIRADIDALRIHDEKKVSYRSQIDGVMHACGHDGHTATVAGAIAAVADLHKSGVLPFRPAVRGVFQPAEETCEGATSMIGAGALDGVHGIISAHMDPTRSVGRIGIRSGVLTANCDLVSIRIKGRGGHAARPHEARDPISAASQLIQWLYTQIPRVTDSQDAVVVTIGMIQGGHTANVIPEVVELQGTMRTLDAKVRERTIKHIQRLAHAVADASETRIRVEFGLAANSVHNDRSLIGLISESANEIIGADSVEKIQRPSMGSEDFAFYCQHVPAAMFRLGCVSEQIGGHGLHTGLFDLDEEAMRVGANIMASTALKWLESHYESTNKPSTAS